MKGYRTLIFNTAMTLLMGGGVQLADLPPTARALMTFAVTAWGLTAILIRVATSTPIGQRIEADIEQQTGITPQQFAVLLSHVADQSGTMNAMSGQFSAVLRAMSDVKSTIAAAASPPAATTSITLNTARPSLSRSPTQPAA